MKLLMRATTKDWHRLDEIKYRFGVIRTSTGRMKSFTVNLGWEHVKLIRKWKPTPLDEIQFLLRCEFKIQVRVWLREDGTRVWDYWAVASRYQGVESKQDSNS